MKDQKGSSPALTPPKKAARLNVAERARTAVAARNAAKTLRKGKPVTFTDRRWGQAG